MRTRLGSLLLYALLVLIGTIPACANTVASVQEPQRLHPDGEQVQLDQTIAGLLTYYHYRQEPLNARRGADILKEYLKALDYNRSYFLASDITRFDRYRGQLANDLRRGDLQPAFTIFNTYLKRLAERTVYIKLRLSQPFDFNIDESLKLDRSKQPWASSRSQLDDYWRRRLKNELLQLMLAGKDPAAAKKVLLRRYVDRLHRMEQYHANDVFQLYMNAVASSYDPHTAYFSPEASENFNIQMSLSLDGIGSVLRLQDEQIEIVELVPGGPAALSGKLHPGDAIVGVGQGAKGPIQDVVGWRLDDVVDLIRGPRGSVVRLEVRPATSTGKTEIVKLVRNKIKLEKQAAHSQIKTVQEHGRTLHIGVITVPAFYSDFAAAQRGVKNYRSTTRDVRKLLTKLKAQHIDGLIIDLRNNGGGALQEAVEMTGLFIPKGPVVQVRNVKGKIDVEKDPDGGQVYSGPLAVLVNRYSASASEIFAAALQDYGRALILGSPTFGKGTVQTLVNLNRFLPDIKDPLGQLKLTIAKFYRISGGSTQLRGVTPDIEFPTAVNSKDVGESAEDFALPWDHIKRLSYHHSGQLSRYLPELRKLHQQRIAHDPEFQAYLADIKAARQARERTEVSLQESKRKAAYHHAELEQLASRNRWRAVKGLPPLKLGELKPTALTTGDADTGPDKAQAGHRPDALLDESAHIVADYATLLARHGDDGTLVMNN